MTVVEEIIVKRLGRVEYLPTLASMRRFTLERGETTPDELWLLEHPPVYTLGQGASPVQVSNAIPVVLAVRGG
jgi:lipoyl(octanoyl) transferase